MKLFAVLAALALAGAASALPTGDWDDHKDWDDKKDDHKDDWNKDVDHKDDWNKDWEHKDDWNKDWEHKDDWNKDKDWEHKDDWNKDWEHKDDWDHDKDWDHKDKHWGWKDSFPFHFTSQIVTWASPDTIVNTSQVAVPGLQGGYGKFAFGLNSHEDVICWGNYSSPARTATHIHQADAGRSGPPRLAFSNPVPLAWESQDLNDWSWRASFGCLQGPFTTGIVTNGTDTGSGFKIADLEANPHGFFADTHTVEFPAGAIRGQLQFKDW